MKYVYNNFKTFVGIIIIILGFVAIFVGSSVKPSGLSFNTAGITGVTVKIYKLTMGYVGAVMIISGFLVIAYDFLKYKNETKKN